MLLIDLRTVQGPFQDEESSTGAYTEYTSELSQLTTGTSSTRGPATFTRCPGLFPLGRDGDDKGEAQSMYYKQMSCRSPASFFT